MSGLARVLGASFLFVATAPVGLADDAELKAVVGKAMTAVRADKIKEVKAWTWTETRKFSGGESWKVTGYAQLPDRYRREIDSTKDGKTTRTVFVVSGDQGWTKTGDEVKELPAAYAADWSRGTNTAAFRTVLRLEDPEYRLALLPDGKVGDRPTSVVKLTRKDVTDEVHFDKESGRLVREDRTIKNQEGKEFKSEVTYDDVRDVGGIPVAHKRTVKQGGEVGMEYQLVELKFADKLDDKLFQKP